MEERLCWQSEDLSWVEESERWSGLKSIGMVKTSLKNMVTGDESTCQRYYISSLPLNSERFLECSRKHWEVENCLHWTLDVVFKEDESRARERNSAKNLSILRLITMKRALHNNQTSRKSWH